MRTRAAGSRGALVGASVGAVLSAAVWLGERAAIANGENAAGVGFGDSHLLFLLCFPWSLPLVAAGTAFEYLGVHIIPFRAFFFAMPVVAGAAWGWLGGRLLRRWRQRSRAESPPPLRRA